MRERSLTPFMPMWQQFLCQSGKKKLCRCGRGRQFVYFTLERRMTKAKSWFIAANADLQEKKATSIYFLDILANKPYLGMIKQIVQWRRCITGSVGSNILLGVRYAEKVRTHKSSLKLFIFSEFPWGPIVY